MESIPLLDHYFAPVWPLHPCKGALGIGYMNLTREKKTMNEMQQAFDIIRQQQAKLPEYSPAVMVGHQLMDLLKMQPEAAGFVLHDLQGKGMGIADCEQRIEAWADEHKKGGSCVCVPPDTAEQIIRKFYGIPAPEETKQRALGLAINLADFL